MKGQWAQTNKAMANNVRASPRQHALKLYVLGSCLCRRPNRASPHLRNGLAVQCDYDTGLLELTNDSRAVVAVTATKRGRAVAFRDILGVKIS
jgi:hypothetical protein